MTNHNGHICNPMELLSKTNFWACIGNYDVLTEIINVFEFCNVLAGAEPVTKYPNKI